jgi:two-component system, chemotaxis family, protein-glutamate methylesterase/glutaminase
MAEGNVDAAATDKLVVIGGSAGGLDVILHTLPNIRTDLPLAIVIVLHRKSNNDAALAELLATRTKIPVKEAEEKEPIKAGIIYLAPADYHLLIEEDRTFSFDFSEKVNYSRPSIDVTFDTASEAFGTGLVCILLSGANADGVNGLIAANRRGCIVAVQDPASAEVAFMPQQALQSLRVDHVLNVAQMAPFINKCAVPDC